MKAYLFVLFCLFISIFSENCNDIKVNSESDCFFANKTNDNNTCCYVNGTSNSQTVQQCIEVNFEEFDSYFNDTELQKSYIRGKASELASLTDVYDYKCDSDVRETGTYSSQNYLYVGLLATLSLLF